MNTPDAAVATAYDVDWLVEDRESSDELDPVPTPEEMRFIVHAQSKLNAILADKGARRPKGWRKFEWNDDFGPILTPAELERFLDPSWITHSFVDTLLEQGYLTDRQYESMTEDGLFNQLRAFVRQPTREAAASFPFSKTLDDPVAYIEHAIAYERRSVARQLQEEVGASLVLRTPPQEFDPLDGELELWMHVRPSENMENAQADLLDLQVSVVLRRDGTRPAVIAYLAGEYIDVMRHGPGELFEIMDAHSQGLNDAWRAIERDLIRPRGLRAFEELERDVIRRDPDRGLGLLVPWIEVHEPYRGRGVAEWLLRMLYECMFDPRFLLDVDGRPLSNLSRRLSRRAHVTSADAMLQQLVGAPVAIHALAIDGTVNEARSMRNVLARGSIATLASPAVLDLEAERRRRALNRHFATIAAGNPQLLLHCFNPMEMAGT